MAAGSTIFGSIMGGQEQVTQNAIQRLQFEEQEFQKKLQNQIQNRQIADQNAAKWMANKNLEKAANKARGEEEFWLGYNFDNAVGQFSRQHGKMLSGIKASLTSKGISSRGGTAQQIMRTALEQGSKGLINKRISQGNAMLSADRKHKAILAKRDHGYSNNVAFMPGQLYQQSDSSIMSGALTTGLVQGAFAGVSAGVQTHLAFSDSMGDNPTGESQWSHLFGGSPSGGSPSGGSPSGTPSWASSLNRAGGRRN
jgi:hypothetical protein